MDLQAYLDRIDYHPPQGRQHLDLGRMHRQHLLHVPFENLSIHLGQPIDLSDEALFDKLVTRGRGGFCFEMNGLFRRVMEAYDLPVALLACAVYSEERESFGLDFSHMALIVYYQYDYWLVDVGFGRSFPEPLRLMPHQIQIMDGVRYQLAPEREGTIVVQRSEGGKPYQPLYRFKRMAHQFEEFFPMCQYHQTSPDSPFTQRRLISRLTAEGRVTLTGQVLKTTEGGSTLEQAVGSEADFERWLQEYFGLDWQAMQWG